MSDRAALDWSNDKKRVFFGIKEQVPCRTPPTGTRKSTDELANVDVWNSADERIQSQQMIRAEADRNFTFRSAFDVSAPKFITLADETMRDLEVAQDGRWAVGRDTRGYISDYKRAAADIYRVNTTTGERTLMLKNQLITRPAPTLRHFARRPALPVLEGQQVSGVRPRRGHQPTWAAAAGELRGHGVRSPGPKPSYGIAGYTSDGKSVLVQHRYDLWLLPLDGRRPAT